MPVDKSSKKPVRVAGRSSWVALAGAIAVADLYTKKTMQEWLAAEGGVYEVASFLDFRSVYNTGAAFGFLADTGVNVQNFLAGFAFVFCMAIYAFLMLYRHINLEKAFIAALLLGGGAGNATERIVYGRVYDFIDFHLGQWHWPAFNLADMAISLSIICLLLLIFRPAKPATDPPTETDEDT